MIIRPDNPVTPPADAKYFAPTGYRQGAMRFLAEAGRYDASNICMQVLLALFL